MSTTDAPVEHRIWALDRKLDKEHVAFPAFVHRFKYFDKAEAHRAFGNLLDYGRISELRLRKIRSDYEHFKINNDDLYWSERLTDRSSEIVVQSASVYVQEAGLKRVEGNLQRYLDKHGLEGRERGRAPLIDILENNKDGVAQRSTRKQERSKSAKRNKSDRLREQVVAGNAVQLANADGSTEELGFQDAEPNDSDGTQYVRTM